MTSTALARRSRESRPPREAARPWTEAPKLYPDRADWVGEPLPPGYQGVLATIAGRTLWTLVGGSRVPDRETPSWRYLKFGRRSRLAAWPLGWSDLNRLLEQAGTPAPCQISIPEAAFGDGPPVRLADVRGRAFAGRSGNSREAGFGARCHLSSLGRAGFAMVAEPVCGQGPQVAM